MSLKVESTTAELSIAICMRMQLTIASLRLPIMRWMSGRGVTLAKYSIIEYICIMFLTVRKLVDTTAVADMRRGSSAAGILKLISSLIASKAGSPTR